MMTSSNFQRYWTFVRGIHRSPVNYPHKGQWSRALMFSLICAWINGWVINREAGNLRRHRAHYYVIVMVVANVRNRPANGSGWYVDIGLGKVLWYVGRYQSTRKLHITRTSGIFLKLSCIIAWGAEYRIAVQNPYASYPHYARQVHRLRVEIMFLGRWMMCTRMDCNIDLFAHNLMFQYLYVNGYFTYGCSQICMHMHIYIFHTPIISHETRLIMWSIIPL